MGFGPWRSPGVSEFGVWCFRFSAVLACFLPLLLTGCTSPGGGAAGGGTIAELHLISLPVALDLDRLPGPDGFGVKLFAVALNQPKPVPIRAGSLEVLMYDGRLSETNLTSLKPRRTWTFTAPQLRAFELTTSIGTSYQFALPWGNAKPTNDQITVLAGYTSPQGAKLYSEPNSILLTAK